MVEKPMNVFNEFVDIDGDVLKVVVYHAGFPDGYVLFDLIAKANPDEDLTAVGFQRDQIKALYKFLGEFLLGDFDKVLNGSES